MNLSEWNLNKKDKICIIILAVFSLIVTLKLLEFYMSGGIFNPDTAVYLISAYKYAGMDLNNICDVNDLFYTPILSYLTALLMMLGVDGKFSIYFVSSIFGIFGFFGLYFLFRYRFNQILSLFGTILFGSCTIVLLNFANGMIDIPGVSISIWMLFFGLLATDKNPKYFYILFPLSIIGFFTRYTTAFTLPVIFLYYLIKKDVIGLLDNYFSDRTLFKKQVICFFKSYEFRCIIFSLLISTILTILICKFLLLDYGCSLTFLQQSQDTLNINNANPNAINYYIHKKYYLEQLNSVSLFGFHRSFDSTLTFLTFSILFGGFSIKVLNIFKNIPFFDFFKSYKKEYKTKYLDLILIVSMILSILISFIEFKIFSNHLISNLFLLISFIIFFSLINRYQINKDIQSINLVMFSWFLIYFIFISLYPIKTYRYVIPLLPPFIYFVVYGLESILHTLSFDLDTFDSLKSKFCSGNNSNDDYLNWMNIFPVILIVILIISTFTFIAPWEIQDPIVPTLEQVNGKGYINDLINITEYIQETDPNYHSKDIACYYHHYRMIKFYLQTNVTFINDDYKEIDLSNCDYVILNEKVRFDNYHKIYNCGDFYLYYHN